jgi:hypothetical protein
MSTFTGTDHMSALLERADARRRLSRALGGAVRSLWWGLGLGIAIAVAARWTAWPALAALGPALVVLAALAGAVLGAPRRDLALAAAQVDRRGGLEATLTTGLEVRAGRLGNGRLALAALRQAEHAAAALEPEVVPIELPARARYVAIPAAVLCGIMLLPSTRWAARSRTVLVPVGGAAAAGKTDLAEGEAEAHRKGEFAPEARSGREEVAQAVRREAEDAARSRDALARIRPPSRRGGAAARAPEQPGVPDRNEAGSGDEERGGEATVPGDAGSSSGRAPVDQEEEAAIREQFPEYMDIVRRYFAGPR